MSKLGNIDECMKNDVVYRVTILDGKKPHVDLIPKDPAAIGMLL